MFSRCRLICLLLVFFLLPQVALGRGQRFALVIGNAHYGNWDTLRNPTNDASAIANELKALGFTLIGADGKPSDGPVLDLGQNRFIEAYLNFAEAARGADIALIYYAGHGMQIGGRSYLLPVDVPKQRIRLIQANSVSLDDILQELDGKARLTVAVFDACREIPELDPVVQRAVRGSGLSRSAFRGLARVRGKVHTVGQGRLVAYSGAAGQVVADGGRDSHSPYTELLLEVLRKNPYQPVETIFQNVVSRFSQHYGGQTPELLIQGNVPPRHYYFIRHGDKRNPDADSAYKSYHVLIGWARKRTGIDENRMKRSRKKLRKMAAEGNVVAKGLLSLILWNGYGGMSSNKEMAIKDAYSIRNSLAWKADNGNSYASLVLGMLYENNILSGSGAEEWYRKSARDGNEIAKLKINSRLSFLTH